MEILDKIELIEKLWNDETVTIDFIVSQTTNSIYMKFRNKKWVRISDHNNKHNINWIDINRNIWQIQDILLRISETKSSKKAVQYEDISL